MLASAYLEIPHWICPELQANLSSFSRAFDCRIPFPLSLDTLSVALPKCLWVSEKYSQREASEAAILAKLWKFQTFYIGIRNKSTYLLEFTLFAVSPDTDQCLDIRSGPTTSITAKAAFTNATAWCLLPAVGVCFPGYAEASKSINTDVNHV